MAWEFDGWVAFGIAAQGVFAARMLVQWIASEKRGASIVPEAFWWISLVGALSSAVYFVHRRDVVGILSQSFGLVVYVRNLWMIVQRRRATAGESAETSEAAVPPLVASAVQAGS